ncbi:MAG TPA: hypothetical protein VH437_01460 [Terriglobales bacterium]
MFKKLFYLSMMGLALASVSHAQRTADVSPAAPPPYCNPCIFYSGDFDPRPAKEPNGLLNGIFAGPTDGHVWVPFAVSNKIRIQGLIANQLFTTPPPPDTPVTWEIRAGVSSGNGGTVQCSGSGTAHATPTGRTFVSGSTTYSEWTYKLTLAPSDYCDLRNPTSAPAEQDKQILPPGGKGQCPPNCYFSMTGDNTAAAPLAVGASYLSDIPSPAAHHFGLPNVLNNSFFSSTSFGYNFVPATTACAAGQPVAITQVGCHMFSVGLTGIGK